MKSAYELAMERLNKSAPVTKLSDEQKKQMADLDSRYAAKIAERELFLKGEIEKATIKGDFASAQQFQEQWVRDRKSLSAELEEKKEEVRQNATSSK